jgi:hypothetical protein
MSRFTFSGLWLLVPVCLAQTTTLRPDAAPDNAFGIDDLEFQNTVPEPASYRSVNNS